ncbi:MAG: amidohydrolase family protein [Bryobacterales bacterium]|nr:amidohydrolase family protein [Bryobacterales bacterium]
MIEGYKVYDTHTHLGVARHSGRVFTADRMLQTMDDQGIDRSLLIPFPVVDDYRWTHDLIGEAIAAHPDRFAGAACLNPFIPEADFRAEVKRCAEQYGFRALKFQPQYQPLNPTSSRSDFLFETALENNMAVIAHTGTGAPFALPSLFILPAQKFPKLPIVLAHCGGSVYALEALVAAKVCPNIYLELSSLMPHHLGEILQSIPHDRLMIGSDLPESVATEIGKIFTLRIPKKSKRDILWNTARRLFDGK